MELEAQAMSPDAQLKDIIKRLTRLELSFQRYVSGLEEELPDLASLTSIQRRLYTILHRRLGTIFEYDTLLNMLYGHNAISRDRNTLKVHVSQLRSRLIDIGSDYRIYNSWNVGYKMVKGKNIIQARKDSLTAVNTPINVQSDDAAHASAPTFKGQSK